jgi:hypothetical protein
MAIFNSYVKLPEGIQKGDVRIATLHNQTVYLTEWSLSTDP